MKNVEIMTKNNDSLLLQTEDTLLDIIEQIFPPSQYDYDTNIIYAFGYGSGVLSQQQQVQQQVQSNSNDNNNTKNMIDIIFVVQNVQLFHEQNIIYNQHHYNFTTTTRPQMNHDMTQQNRVTAAAQQCTWVQCHTVPTILQSWFNNPGVYFHLVDNIYHNQQQQQRNQQQRNHQLHHEEKNITKQGLKYGIIQYDTLINDLQNWTHLYIAGRMHKPIISIPIYKLRTKSQQQQQQHQQLSHDDPKNILQNIHEQKNLPAAFATALLYQWYDDNNRLTDTQQEQSKVTTTTNTSNHNNTNIYLMKHIYEKIVQISYNGDPRIGIFEDPYKIQNIVKQQYNYFQKLYLPILQQQNFLNDGYIELIHTDTPNNNVVIDNNTSTTSNNNNNVLNQHYDDDQQQQLKLKWNWDHPNAHDRLWQCIPNHIRQLCNYTSPIPTTITKTIMNSTMSDSYITKYQINKIQLLQNILSTKIVAPAARYQSIKGLYSTGLYPSLYYLYRKFTKGKFYKKLF